MIKKNTINSFYKNKTTPVKTKKSIPKQKDNKKQPECFVITDQGVFVASTKTDRKRYFQFQKQAKTSKQKVNWNSRISSEGLSMQDYVRTLTKQQKQQLLHKLQEQIEGEQSISKPNINRIQILQQRLQELKGQLIQKFAVKIQAINQLFEQQQIGLEQKNQKIRLIQKIRENKLSLLSYTRVLFQKIIYEDVESQIHREEKMDEVIRSLQNFSTQSLPIGQNESQNEPYERISVSQRSQQPIQFKQNKQNQNKAQQNKKQSSEINNNKISLQSLKLDIRLDQVKFGQDHYEQQKQNIQNIKLDKFQKQQNNSQQNSQKENILDQNKGIIIPLLMTKQKIQQIEEERAYHEIQQLNIQMKARHAFQVSDYISENTNHFTTLIDVNQFIVTFYQFLTKKYLRQVIEGMNQPFGKSCLDKLFQLRNQGLVLDSDHCNILPEQFLNQYHKQMALTTRRISQNQRYHNKAVFQAFNSGLNVYRPYYQLQGEVFPWNTSEKGLTFYEISEQNIQQVFQKSKMKVLQYCASLCGILPECSLSTEQSKKVLNKRNEDTHERILKNETLQKYAEWNIKIVNFQALTRLKICQQIFQNQLLQVLKDLIELNI